MINLPVRTPELGTEPDIGLTFYIQAIVDLATGRPIGYEWLTRPTRGPSATALWMWADRTAHIPALSQAVFAAAAHYRARLPGTLFLNVDVQAIPVLTRWPHREACFAPWVVELTERAVPTPLQWDQLQQWAVELAVDDFGMGDDFLGKLLEWPVQWMKLDRSIVQHCATDAAYQDMVRYLLTITTRRGITVIAEGIETSAEYQGMRALGIPYGQGYRWGRPQSVSHEPWMVPHDLGVIRG